HPSLHSFPTRRSSDLSEDGAPQVRPEHVRVQDVEPLAAQQRYEPCEGAQVVAARTVEALVAKAGVDQLFPERSLVAPRGAHRHEIGRAHVWTPVTSLF